MKKEFIRLCVYYALGIMLILISIGLLEHNNNLNNHYRVLLAQLQEMEDAGEKEYISPLNISITTVKGSKEDIRSRLPEKIMKETGDTTRDWSGYHLVNDNLFYQYIYYLDRDGENYAVGYFRHPRMTTMSIYYLPYAIVPYVGICLLTYFYLKKRKEEINSAFDELMLSLEYEDIDIKETEDEPLLLPFSRDLKDFQRTYRKNMERIRNQLQFMEEVYTNLTEGIILLDENRNILSLNDASVRFFSGSPFVNYRGRSFDTLIKNDELIDTISKAYEDGHPATVTMEEENEYLKIYLHPMDNEEDPSGIVLLIHDIKDQITLETMRREFTSNVTHELKTPLTSIQGYAELLSEGFVPPEDQSRVAKIILKESQRLFHLIHSLIELSRLEESSGLEDFEHVEIPDIINEMMPGFQVPMSEKNIKFKMIDELKQPIYGNPSILHEIFSNLLENAIRYNVQDGEIEVRLWVNRFIHVTIRDTGIGMPSWAIERIFERFYMVDNSRSMNKDSSGLGLAIVKHGVLYHGGDIKVTSKLGEGSTFDIQFPLKLLDFK